ncbi:unnamed protein product [Discosporangium mesarthrocarpum]
MGEEPILAMPTTLPSICHRRKPSHGSRPHSRRWRGTAARARSVSLDARNPVYSHPLGIKDGEIQEPEAEAKEGDPPLQPGGEAGGILGAQDEESQRYLASIRGLVDAAVKLLGADDGVGNWLMSSMLRKTGVISGFIDSLVLFVDHRVSAVVDELAIRNVAYNVAARLRRHVHSHQAVMEALHIPNGLGRSQAEAGGSKLGPYPTEDEVEGLLLWREWKNANGFWPSSMPDPDDPKFEGREGEREFRSMCDEGIQSLLRTVSGRILKAILPKDADELSAIPCATRPRDARSARETASRLAHLRDLVLEPLMGQVLEKEVVRKLGESRKLCQLILNRMTPTAEHHPLGFGLRQREAFCAVASVVSRVGRVSSNTLRMELMQGLVRMNWEGSTGGTSVKLEGDRDSATSDVTPPMSPMSTDVLNPGRSTAPVTRAGRASSFSEADRGSLKGQRRSLSQCPRAGLGTDARAGLKTRTLRSGSFSEFDGEMAPMGVGAGAIFSVPYLEQLAKGLGTGRTDKYEDSIEAKTLEAIRDVLEAQLKKTPVKFVVPLGWVDDRIQATKEFARRPTNKMLILTLLEALSFELEHAGDKVRSGAPSKEGSRVASTTRARKNSTDSDIGPNSGTIWHTSSGGKRHAAGRRVWRLRRGRDQFFGFDVTSFGQHVGRSLLGDDTVGFVDAWLKGCTLEHVSLGGVMHDEAVKALDKLEDVGTSTLLAAIKPVSQQPILYVTSQLAILRMMKKYGLDFSKSFGQGPQSKALGRRFKGYCWMFTDSLIDKLVSIRVRKEVLGDKGQADDSTRNQDTRSTGEGEGAESKPDEEDGGDEFLSWGPSVPKTVESAPLLNNESFSDEVKKKLRTAHKWHKITVCREVAGITHSRDLLRKVQLEWLPAIAAEEFTPS